MSRRGGERTQRREFSPRCTAAPGARAAACPVNRVHLGISMHTRCSCREESIENSSQISPALSSSKEDFIASPIQASSPTRSQPLAALTHLSIPRWGAYIGLGRRVSSFTFHPSGVPTSRPCRQHSCVVLDTGAIAPSHVLLPPIPSVA